MIPMITKKDVTKSDYQRLLKYPWFYPTITKKQKRYLPDLFRNIDDDLEVLKGEHLSVKTVKYSLKYGRSISHCDVIFMYKIKNQGFKFFNINQLIIRKKINDKNELIVELNASALSKLNKQISKNGGVVIYPPIFWYTVHVREKILNFNKSGLLYYRKSNLGQKEFDYSIYDKGNDNKLRFNTLEQTLNYLS